MTDKEKLDKLVAEIKKLRKEVKDNIAELGNSESERIGLFKDLEIYDNILSFNDSIQEEPQVEESAKTQHIKEMCKENGDSLTQEPVNKDFEMALTEMIDKAQKCVVEPWVVAAQWKDELIKLAKSEEPVNEDFKIALEKKVREAQDWTYIEEEGCECPLSEEFGAYDLEEFARWGANWQKEKLLAKAVDAVVKIDAGGYPYVDRTIELYDYDKNIPLAKCGDKVKILVIKEE